MTGRFVVSKYPGEQKRYYIQDTYLLYSCSVECFNVSIPHELEKAREIQYQIDKGRLIGVRIPDYAVYIHPSKSAYNSEHVKVTKNLLPSMHEMASFFYEEILKPDSYLFYHSYVEDETLLQPTSELITRIEEGKSGPHFITVPRPKRNNIDGIIYEIKQSWLNQILRSYGGMYAQNKEGRLLSASIRLFDNKSVVKRKLCKQIVNKAVAGEKFVAKVKGYQILIIARTWKEHLLTEDDVLVLLNQMATYYLSNVIQSHPRIYDSFHDISDEVFEKKLIDKEIRDDSYKRPLTFACIIIGIAILVFLGINGIALSAFGIIMFIAYLDVMLKRR